MTQSYQFDSSKRVATPSNNNNQRRRRKKSTKCASCQRIPQWLMNIHTNTYTYTFFSRHIYSKRFNIFNCTFWHSMRTELINGIGILIESTFERDLMNSTKQNLLLKYRFYGIVWAMCVYVSVFAVLFMPSELYSEWHSCWVSCSCSQWPDKIDTYCCTSLTNDVCIDRVTKPIYLSIHVSMYVSVVLRLRDAKHPTFLINYRPQAHLTNVIMCKFIRPLFHILLAGRFISAFRLVGPSIWLFVRTHRKSCNENPTEKPFDELW